MKTILIQSLKGGTGKTETTVGLGRALAASGKKVGFLDIDWIAPNLHIKLGVPPNQEIQVHGRVGDTIDPVITSEGFPIISSSFIFPDDQAISMDDEAKIKDIMEVTSPGVVNWGKLDYLLVDTPPTTSQFIQAALKMPGMWGVVLVVQPSLSAMADLLRTVCLLKDEQVPIIGMVGNQVYLEVETRSRCRRISLYELTEDDIRLFSESHGIPYLGSTPHVLPSQGRIDLSCIAAKIEESTPVILPKKEPSELPLKLLMAVVKTRRQNAKKKEAPVEN